MDTVIYFFQYLIFFFSVTIALAYFVLAILSYFNTLRTQKLYTDNEYELLQKHPEGAPGISVVAPAYNEGNIIADCVMNFLSLNYPNFEVVIVNDGSKDDTLKNLIDEFDLEEIPYPYVERIYSQPVRGIFKSTNPSFHRLTVVDKENGGTKADAMNAGINVAKYAYFINTDIDGLLEPDTLPKMIMPVLNSETQVIAVGATMRMVNGCDVHKGKITQVKPPHHFFPTFQETEYLRSYLITKMGWSVINAIPNVSGGFGLFDKAVVIGAGGYDPLSQAEDMDMTLRMIAYMRDNDKKYRIRQIPQTCCWTEGPHNLKLFYRQRTRWGRGFLQILLVHRRFLFNPRYGRLGLLILPYALLLDLVTPVLTFIGLSFLVYLLINNQVNFGTFWLMMLFVYLIGISMSLIAITADLSIKKLYKNYLEYGRLIIFSLVEIVLYQPLNIFFTVIGYIQFIIRREFKWTDMTRQGYTRDTEATELVENVK